MESIIFVLLSGCVIALASLSGIFFIAKKHEKWFFANSRILTVFAVAVLSMTALSVVSESFKLLPFSFATLSVIGGFVLMLLIHKLIPEGHHHHDQDCGENKKCLPKASAVKVIVGDSLHNIVDGIILVVAFATSIELGVIIALGIFIHEVVQEIAEFTILRQAGYSVKKSLFWNFVSALFVFVGIALGFTLTQSSGFQGILLGLSAGVFLHIIFHDMWNIQSIKQAKQNGELIKFVLVFLVGFGIMFGINSITPHSHGDDDHHHEHEEYMEHHHDYNDIIHKENATMQAHHEEHHH